jgi:hypothetical protein
MIEAAENNGSVEATTDVYPNGEGEKLKPKPGTRGSVNDRTRLRRVLRRPIK